MSDELIPLLKDYLEAASKDRNYLALSLDDVKKTLDETRKCLTTITTRSIQMHKDATAMKETCKNRIDTCNKTHDDFEHRLRSVPSVELDKIRDEKFKELSSKIDAYPSAKVMHDLNAKMDKVLIVLYMIIGIAGFLQWGLPFALSLLK